MPCKKCDRDFLIPYWRQFGLVQKWDQICTGNPIIFLANAMEIPWLELVHNPCHVLAWTTNGIWINDMELSRNLYSWDLDQTAVDLWHHEMTWNFHENPRHIFYRVYDVWYDRQHALEIWSTMARPSLPTLERSSWNSILSSHPE